MTKKYYKINQYIRAETVRVIDQTGKQIGVMSLTEALNQARSSSLDLVEVSENAKPPVCKLINFKKFLFQENKKEQDDRKKTKKVDIKEVRLTLFIAENDLNFRLKRAEEFISGGDRVKVTIRFRGREMTKKDFGYELMKKVVTRLEPIAKPEHEPKFFGNQLEILFNPVKKGKNENKTKV